MQSYTQTRAVKKIEVDTLISKHWQLIMRVTSSAASGWVVLTASQPCVSAQGGFKAPPRLDSRATHLQMFQRSQYTYMHTFRQLRFKVDFSSRREEDTMCLKSWHMEETQYWALVYWGLWVVSGWCTESCSNSQMGGGRSLRREFEPNRHQCAATKNSLQASLWLLQNY